MPLSTDVIVREKAVSFPRRCVVCCKPVDAEDIILRGNPVGFYGVIPWLFGATKKLEVPAHQKCGSELSRAMMIRNLSLIVGVLLVVIVAASLGLTKWQAIGLAMAATAAPIIIYVVRPLAFEFTYQSSHFKLMFLDPDYAREIADLNNGELEDDEGKSGSEQFADDQLPAPADPKAK